MRKFSFLLVALLLTPLTHAVDDERAAYAYDSREGLFAVVRLYFGPMYGMMRGAPYNGEVVQHNAVHWSKIKTNHCKQPFTRVISISCSFIIDGMS